MSIASEITRLQNAKNDLATSIANKGVTVPASATLDDYAALVDSIQTGGGGGSTLPYDAEVEYLHSDGNQYIDTGVRCISELKVQFVGLCTTDVNAALCGGITGSSPYFRHHWSPISTNFYWIQRSTASTSSVSMSSNFLVNTWYDVTIDPVNGTAIVNGTSSTFTAITTLYTTTQNYYIFARKATNGTAQTRPGRFKMFKIWWNDILLRDFIPVRVGTVGYLYDKVSGTLFGNSGTGNFTLGNDVTT